MTLSTLGIDAYQLTTLLAHADLGRLDQRVTMSFFFRRMPKNRSYVVFCALRRILETRDISMMQATPAMWRLLLQSGWRGDQKLRLLCGVAGRHALLQERDDARQALEEEEDVALMAGASCLPGE